MLEWLLAAAAGPAAVALPVNWAGDTLADVARRWFARFRGTDDLSRLVRAAAGTSAVLTHTEFSAVRRLLEDQQTWILLRQGSVDDLAVRISRCLPPGVSGTGGDPHGAGLAIARGLLEFAVADLDPKLFQQVLLARLERVAADQANALDVALLGLHARFPVVKDQLRLVMDRLPPGPARLGELVVYLRTLIDWLGTDPWPRGPQFDGPVLDPAAIERKLRVTVTGRSREQDVDADGLVQSRRLVILGDPGAGKTWLARRAARRCAEDALQALETGRTADEVELPVYTTCSHLFAAGGGIREAVVSSALDQLADLGGSRISAALHTFFTERNAPTVLVIDSLDEAHGPSERLRQADTLPWRIILTSRPSSWRNQLAINDDDESHRVGELQPLRYPDDVEPFIERWFAGQPRRGRDLAAQIALRPDLQRTATVPLLLAFYCIVAGSGPLPEYRHDLYTRVLRRMLTGRWRGDDDRHPDGDICLQTLQSWAWTGASNDPVSGVGTWTDDIATERFRLGEDDANALDHVAPPLGPPDVDTGRILRRFVHRSLREHLVAQRVASLPVDQAVTVLLPHLWYDPDWENVIPAALAQHPERDQLVRDLIRSPAHLDQTAGDLPAIDACLQVRGLLVRIAEESSEASWSSDVADMITQARYELSWKIPAKATTWRTSNRQIREALLKMMAENTDPPGTALMALAVLCFDPTAENKRQAREILVGLLTRESDHWVAARLASVVARLDPADGDKRQAREVLLRLLGRETGRYAVAELAGVLVELAPAAEDQLEDCARLVDLLDDDDNDPFAGGLVDGVVRLAVTAESRCRAREVLLRLLARKTNMFACKDLATGAARLAVTAEDKQQAREMLLRLLLDEETVGWGTPKLAEALASLDPATRDRQQAGEMLLRLLLDEEISGVFAAELAGALALLDPAEQDKQQARAALLSQLARETDWSGADKLVGALALLDPAEQDKQQARAALLRLLAVETHEYGAAQLAHRMPLLSPAPQDRCQAREALLTLLSRETVFSSGSELAAALAELDPGTEDKQQACEMLLRCLAARTDGPGVHDNLVAGVVRLATTTEERRQARGRLLRMLAHETCGWKAVQLAQGLDQLEPMAEDKQQAREALLRCLAAQTDGAEASRLAGAVTEFGPTADDKRQTREVLLRLLPQDPGYADSLMANALAQLDPAIHDLLSSGDWRNRLTAELLAAARRRTALTDWLEALPLVHEAR